MRCLGFLLTISILPLTAAAAGSSDPIHLETAAGQTRRFPLEFLGDLPEVEIDIDVSKRPRRVSGIEIQIVDQNDVPSRRFTLRGSDPHRPRPHLQVLARECSMDRELSAQLELSVPSAADAPDIRRRVRTLDLVIVNRREGWAACAPAFSLGMPAAGVAGLLAFGFLGYGITARRSAFFRKDDLSERIRRLTWGDGLVCQLATARDSNLDLSHALKKALGRGARARAWLVGGLFHLRYRETLELIVTRAPGSLELGFRLISDPSLPYKPGSKGRAFLVAGNYRPRLIVRLAQGDRLAGGVQVYPERSRAPLTADASGELRMGTYWLAATPGAAAPRHPDRTAGWVIRCG
jgi:hypothetical protein